MSGTPIPEVVGHRGSAATAPENTLESVAAAFDRGADAVEVDVQRTADGALVLLHDASPARTTDLAAVRPDRTGALVGDLTLRELRSLDAGAWFAPRFAGARIPTLRELLEAVRGRGGVMLEAKDPWRSPGIAAQIADEVAAVPGVPVLVQSFDAALVREFAALRPGTPRGRLHAVRPTDTDLDDDARVAGQVTTEAGLMDDDLVTAIRARGLSPGVYTVNEPAEMRRLISLGVDRIISDDPGLLAGIVAARER